MGRDLALAVAWAAFIGVGVAGGLWLGSLGADVPADAEMLVFVALVAGSLTLIVRVGNAMWTHRPGRQVVASASRADRPSESDGDPDDTPAEGARRPGRPGTTRSRPGPAQRPRRPATERSRRTRPAPRPERDRRRED